MLIIWRINWHYKGYPGIPFVTFELFEKGNKTSLKLTHSCLEAFPEDNVDFAVHNFREGWNYIINTSLKDYLNKK